MSEINVDKILGKNLVENIETKDFYSIVQELEDIFGKNILDMDMLKTMSSLITLSEESFRLVAPTVLDSFERRLNNPNLKFELAQSLNASGLKAEDLIENFNTLSKNLEETTIISRQKREFAMELVAIICNSIMTTEGIAKKVISIPIELCNENAKLPEYANISDSGMDLFAIEDITINPGQTVLVPTGIKIALPPGYELQVRPKSGRALKTKLRVANTPGTIDAGYRDEIKVIIENVESPIKDITYDFDENTHFPIITSIEHGASYTIGKGEKFAQLVLMEVPKVAFFQVESVLEIGENRGGGFGSTGLK